MATFVPKIKKHVTLPLLKMVKDTPYYVRFESAMFKAKEVTAARNVDPNSAAAQKREPPMLAQVVNLENGEMAQIICPAVLVSELNNHYPDEAYRGRCFAIELKKVEGKSYNLVNVTEIEDPKEAEDAAKEQAGGKAANGRK